MSGGKSNSQQHQDSTQGSADGVNTGTQLVGGNNDVAQTVLKAGGGINLANAHIEQVPEAVAEAFDNLIALASSSIDANKALSQSAQNIIASQSSDALNKVGDRAEAATQPDLSTITKLVPVAIVALIALTVVQVFKK